MKRIFATFFFVVFLFGLNMGSAFAQDVTGNDSRIWSKVQIDRNAPAITNESQYRWIPVDPKYQYYRIGNTEVTVSPNYRVRPTTNTTQSELSIDVHPTNPSILFGGANTTNWPVSTLYGTGCYWTTNGGLNWSGFDNPPSSMGSNSGDPANVIGTNGYFYVGYIDNPGGQGIARSTDNGTTWTTYTVTPNPGSLADKNHLMIDKKVGSPFENRLYDVWTDFGGANDNHAVLKYSTNFGQTWSSSVNLSSTLSPGSHAQGVNVQTGPNGEVYVAFAIYDNWPTGEDAIGFAKSTDGGVTWTKSRVYGALTPNGSFNFGIRGNIKPTSIRVASFPSMAVDRSGGPNNGYIYITWPQRGVTPAGSDPDVVMIRSTDGGTTWSAPVRVNDDALNNGKDQYFPWCTVDQTDGNLYVVFYDNRETTNDSSGVYMAVSYNGGISFTNFRVSDQNFRPKPIAGLAGGYQGDYIGITAANGKIYPFWADDRTGNYQAWLAEVTVGPPCPVDPASNPTPADGLTNVPISIAQLQWTNGTGATQCEVWFGEGSNLTQIYNGPVISSIAVPGPLQYNKVYGWRVIGKNDTCSVGGPFWSFRTELSPGTLFIEPFPDLANWTPVGPLGLTNWSTQSSNNAAGQNPPECRLTWTPSFNGTSYLKSINITAPNNTQLDLILKHYLDWYANPSGVLGIAVTYDNGATYTPLWQVNNPTGNIGPETISTSFTTPATDASNLKLALFYTGNSFNIDNWYIDDIELTYVIPVELTSFTAKAIDNDVELIWNTATESNNQGFEIQRSNGGGFEAVGYIPGFGTTTEHKSYSFTDKNVKVGKYTYRLKQIDYDGQYVFSNTVEVEVNPPLTFALEQNYPNPFNPSTLIKYSLAKDAMVNVSVYNTIGERVATLVNGFQQAGRYEVSFNAGNLTSGVYFYSIEAGDFKSVKKMLLMK
mgnify:FL=1|uniref:T9SS type A sorting domain-containing protein n=1 Tax=Ignavibacterium album TaxID=591197 RepID=A0A7V2ZLA7_9BACT